MGIHVLEEKVFFRASIPVADQQRLVLLPGPRGVEVGDTLFLRNEAGELTWVADVLRVQTTGGPQAWGQEEAEQPYVVAGWLAKVHPGTLPLGRARLAASWVTLNSRTIVTAIPWHEGANLVYHHTMHLVEGILTDEELELAKSLGIVLQHRSGHWLFPMGDARKRFLVQVRREPLTCSLCGGAIASLEECTQDHRLPSSQGGPDVLGNLQLAHKTCNEIKGNALPEQYPPVFVPPGQEDGRYGYRRSRRRPLGTPSAFTAERLAPVAAAGNGNGQPVQAPAARVDKPSQTQAKTVQPGVTKPAPVKAAEIASAKAAPGKAAEPAPATAARTQPAKAAEEKKEAKPARRSRRSTAKAAAAKEPEAKPAVAAKLGTEAAVAAPATAAFATAAAAVPVPPMAAEAQTTPVTDAHAPSMEANPPAAVSPNHLLDGLSAPEEWLRSVQVAGWRELAAMAAGPDWAARTATLRTMCALRRTQVQKAAVEGVLVAERTGKEGRFALHAWKDQQILVEEKGSKRHVHQVHMLQGLAPDVYVWYLSEFGRTAPLTVAMALLALWQAGSLDGQGRVVAKKGSQRLVLTVVDNRLADCSPSPSDTAVA
ncbi:MAG: HNH endonuclease [Firmicutes bacterium]|nr:HNH endonuclease [Bacillota bacterium]